MVKKRTQRQTRKWAELIAIAEAKLAKSQLKTGQLQAVLASFRAQAKAGEPCPTDLAGLGYDLSRLLH
jgi:hypothetical protein